MGDRLLDPSSLSLRPLYGLCDADNFFVSCERVFRPDLSARPVLVLSSNDGCIVSRSAEAKAMGIGMGDPYFKWKNLLEAKKVAVFSANFALYADFSRRLLRLLELFSGDIEVYSIDEAFFRLPLNRADEAFSLCQKIRRAIHQAIGIPVSIGLASSRTLAKLAILQAKRDPSQEGIFLMPEGKERDRLLGATRVGDVWGIGRRLAEFLQKRGIQTARQLRDADDLWLKKNLTIRGLEIAWELRGVSCIRPLCDEGRHQSIQVCRSFGRPLSHLEPLRSAIATFAASAATQLRRKGLETRLVEVVLWTNRLCGGPRSFSCVRHFARPTAYPPDLIKTALDGLLEILHPGFEYAKGGVFLREFAPSSARQRELFEPFGKADSQKRAFMRAVDAVNRTLGPEALRPAWTKGSEEWEPRSAHRSPAYTSELSSAAEVAFMDPSIAQVFEQEAAAESASLRNPSIQGTPSRGSRRPPGF